MNNNENIPSRLTKVLVNKIHGGRKQDSKFWNSENDLGNIEIKDIPKTRKIRYFSIYPFISAITVISLLIILKPDLFPFFDFHNIYNTFFPRKIIDNNSYNKDSISINTTLPQIHSSPHIIKQKPIVSRGLAYPSTSDYNNNNIIDKLNIRNFSTTGKVFSWRDSEGKFHSSNTNFPLDNDTLQVETEINTYHRVTPVKIIKNQIYIPVTIGNNGIKKTFNMVLDTGCSHTTIPYKYLDQVNVKYGRITRSVLADGRKIEGNEVFLDSIEVGPKKQDRITVTGQEVAGSNNTGLLGIDFLKHHSFRVDFNNQFIIWM